MLVGYVRISRFDNTQSIDLQRSELLDDGVGSGCINVDTSGENGDERPGLQACLQALRKGDTLLQTE